MESKRLGAPSNFTHLQTLSERALSDELPSNPLIQAANCFLLSTKEVDARELSRTQQQLLDNLDAFQTILSHYYADSLVLINIYILCFTLDSLMVCRLGQFQHEWAPYRLVEYMFQYNTEDGLVRLLDAVDFICLSEEADTQLFEYVYLCLSISVKNKTDTTPEIKEKIRKVMTRLYKKVCGAKGAFTTKLSIDQLRPPCQARQKKAVPFWLTGILTLVLILTVYIVINLINTTQTNSMLSNLNKLTTQTQKNDKH